MAPHVVEADGSHMSYLLQDLHANGTLTKVYWKDPNIFRTTFIVQFCHGPDSFESLLDAVLFKQYMLHRVHSLDGEFLDDKDGGEFLLFAYEVNLKRKLYKDYVGNFMKNERQKAAGASRPELYSNQRNAH